MTGVQTCALPIWVAELPYVREPHPMYDDLGGVPAIEEVRFSVCSPFRVPIARLAAAQAAIKEG